MNIGNEFEKISEIEPNDSTEIRQIDSQEIEGSQQEGSDDTQNNGREDRADREEADGDKEKIKELEYQINAIAQEIQDRERFINEAKTGVNSLRGELGLSKSEADSPGPSVDLVAISQLVKDKEALEEMREKLLRNLEETREDQKTLEQNKKKIIQEHEKAELIEKREIEILYTIIREFDRMNEDDLQSILVNGMNADGGLVKSSTFGEIDPDTAIILAKAYRDGLSAEQIVGRVSEISGKIKSSLTEIATKEINQEIENRQAEIDRKEYQEQDNQSENTDDDTPEEVVMENAETNEIPTTDVDGVTSTNVQDSKIERAA